MRQITVGVAAAVSIVIVACSSSGERTDHGAKAASVSADASADGSSSEKSGLETKDSSAPPPTTCSSEQGPDACLACCAENNPSGAAAYAQALRTCLCAANACAIECAASVCAPTPTEPRAGDDCSTCMDDAVECEVQTEAACAASAACSALVDCIEESGCEPDVDGGT